MACELTAGRLLPCKDGIGGIFDVYFFNYGVGITTDPSTEEVTDIDDGAEVPASATAYKWKVKSTASTLEETTTSSRDNGTTFWSQALNLTFTHLDPTTRTELKLMAWGRPQVVVVDNNGNALMCGLEDGMEVTGGTTVTGGAKGDLSGYTLVLTGEEVSPANFLQGATKTDPFAGMTTPVTIVDGV